MRKTITITIEEDFFSQLKAAAARENRSLSNFIETVLVRLIEEQA